MKEKFASRIIIELIIKFVSMISSYILIFSISVENYGTIGYVADSIGLLTICMSIGLDSIYYQYNTEKNFKKFFSNFFFLKTILALINFFPVFLYLLIMNFDYKLYFLLIALSNFIAQFSQTLRTNLQTKMKIFLIDLPKFIILILNSLSIIIVVINYAASEKLLIILGLISLIVSILNLISLTIFSSRFTTFFPLNIEIIKRIITDTKPLIIASIFGSLMKYLGKVLIGYEFGTTQFGYFKFVDSMIINIFMVISNSIVVIYVSYYSILFKEKKEKRIQEIANNLERYFSILFLFVILWIFLNGRLFIETLIPKYIESIPYMYFAIFIPYFAGVSRPYGKQLVPGRKQSVLSKFAIIKTSINFVLTIILIPESLFSIRFLGLGAYGYIGILEILWLSDFFVYRFLCKKYFNITSYKKLYMHFIFGTLSFIISYLFKILLVEKLTSNNYLVILLSSIVLFVFYFLIFYFGKEINKKDYDFILELLEIKNYKKSIINEYKNLN